MFALTLYLAGKGARQCIILGNKRGADVILICASIVFTLMCGFRYSVGVDCESYAMIYEKFRSGISQDFIFARNRNEVEQGYVLISRFFAAINAPVFIYMGFLAFAEYFFFFKTFKDRSFLLPYLGLILILGPFFLSWMNGMRQTIASCIFVFAIHLLVDKKMWIWYLLLIGLAVSMHKSALILLPFIFLVFYNHQPNKTVSICILAVCFFLGRFPAFMLSSSAGGLQYLEDLLSVLDYSYYAENVETIADEAVNIKFGIRSIISVLSCLIVVIYSDNLFRSFRNDKFFKVSYLLFLVYFCLSFLTFSLSHIFKRPLLYLMPFVLICQAYSLFHMRHRKNFILLLISIIVFCSYTVLSNVLDTRVAGETTLFKFMIR